jgi:hypothetical protein
MQVLSRVGSVGMRVSDVDVERWDAAVMGVLGDDVSEHVHPVRRRRSWWLVGVVLVVVALAAGQAHAGRWSPEQVAELEAFVVEANDCEEDEVLARPSNVDRDHFLGGTWECVHIDVVAADVND